MRCEEIEEPETVSSNPRRLYVEMPELEDVIQLGLQRDKVDDIASLEIPYVLENVRDKIFLLEGGRGRPRYSQGGRWTRARQC